VGEEYEFLQTAHNLKLKEDTIATPIESAAHISPEKAPPVPPEKDDDHSFPSN
jgi:hypothetical protein